MSFTLSNFLHKSYADVQAYGTENGYNTYKTYSEPAELIVPDTMKTDPHRLEVSMYVGYVCEYVQRIDRYHDGALVETVDISQPVSFNKDSSDSATILTAEKLIGYLSKIPKDTKITIFNDPKCDGYYYLHSIDHDTTKNTITLSCAGCSNANTCDEQDATGKWWKY